MQKHQTVTIIGTILVITLASLLYHSIGPCSKPKIEVGYSNIAELLSQWEEVLEAIESPQSAGISQARVDSLVRIKRRAGSVIVPQCMLPSKIELYYGMEARIHAYSAILENSLLHDKLNLISKPIPITGNTEALVEIDDIRVQISELEAIIQNSFMASVRYFINFDTLLAKFGHRINAYLPPVDNPPVDDDFFKFLGK